MTKNGHVFHPADRKTSSLNSTLCCTTYGIGTTLVGGVGNWFTVDANYTQTQFDILDGKVSMPLPSHLALVTVLPPRV